MSRANWTNYAVVELHESSRVGPLYMHLSANRRALVRWAWWRRFLRRRGIKPPLFMRPWDVGPQTSDSGLAS